MDTEKFKYIVGEIKTGRVATIKFFDKINAETTTQFNAEFDFLENIIKPSLIRVLINCEGGSVLHGMTTYSTIQNSSIETECINEGVAASMGSVIWAAGNKSLMRDYAILMIHNPFLPSEETEQPSDLVLAFINQIKTIYRKRFGLKKETVESIMNGEEGKDGTFFNAHEAVQSGIIPKENILQTSKQFCEKVQARLTGVNETSRIQALMNQLREEEATQDKNKLFASSETNHKYTTKIINEMPEVNNTNPEYTTVAATLGLQTTEIKDIVARISALLTKEKQYEQSQKEIKDAHTVIAGKEATIQNLKTDVQTLTASLDSYKNKEVEEKNTLISSLVEAAIADGKIDHTSKADWVNMFNANFDLSKSTLESIPAREKISAEISADPENIQSAAEAVKTAEEKMKVTVNSVVGESFEFKKIE